MSADPFGPPVWRESHHPASLPPDELLAQVHLNRGRTSGPGGQHRNRVQTLVELTHTPTGIGAHAGERRSPEQNKSVAVGRLRLALAVDHRTPVPDGEARTELWGRRCGKGGRITCSETHDDFAALIAEAMDVAAVCGWDLRKAAARLCTTQSQIVRLLGRHPPALLRLNAARRESGLRPLSPR